MSLSRKKVVVTGAGGFIGSHLADELVRRGASVRAFVHYRSDGARGWLDKSEHAKNMEIVPGDLTDRDSIELALEGREIVFHLGALIAIPYSYAAPFSYIRVNVEGTANLLQAARRHGVARVVHTSTSETYGTARYVPIDEDHPLSGQSPYAASKIGADMMAEAFHRSFGVPVVTLRPFNTYGPRQSARAVIPTIITQCLSGTDVRLGNLAPTRDFNYVTDTVDAFCRAATAPAIEGMIINVGSSAEISIGDLAVLIGELAERPVQPRIVEERMRRTGSEVERLCANNARARELLDWAPRISLRDGLRRTIDWIAANRTLYETGVYVR